MITIAVAVIYVCCGVLYLTPGVLPVAAITSVKWSRHIVGAGMLVAGVSVADMWWRGMAVQTLLLAGLALVGVGLASTLVTILRQPCPPKS